MKVLDTSENTGHKKSGNALFHSIAKARQLISSSVHHIYLSKGLYGRFCILIVQYFLSLLPSKALNSLGVAK